MLPIQKAPEETKFTFMKARGFSSKGRYIDVRPIAVVIVCKTYSMRSSALPSTEFPLQPTRDVIIMVSERFQRKPFVERDRE
jgi:hypothetical protein